MTVLSRMIDYAYETLERATATSVVAAVAAGFATLELMRIIRWSFSGIPGPFPWPFVGQIPLFIRYISKRQASKFFIDLHVQYGPIYRVKGVFNDAVCVSDAEAARQIVCSGDFVRGDLLRRVGQGVTDSALFQLPTDEVWKRHRKLLQPAFGPIHLRHTALAARAVFDEAADMIRAEIAANPRKTEIDLYEYFNAIALDVIGKIAFSYSFGSVAALKRKEHSEARKTLETMLEICMKRMSVPSFLWPLVGLGNSSPWIVKARSYQQDIINKLIKERQDSKSSRKNKDVKDRDGATSGKNRWELDVLDRLLEQNPTSSDTLSEDEIVDELIGFFMAGHETTANTMTFVAMALCQRPDLAKRVAADIDEVYERLGGDVTTENLHEFRLLDWFIKETMRLYTVVDGLIRHSVRPVEVMGYRFPKGTSFHISFYDIHIDPKNWKDPTTFNPDRWAEAPVPRSYVPFGDGPHVCIGQKLANIEARVVILHLIRNFEFELVPGQNLVPISSITNGLKDGLKVYVKESKRTK